MEDGRETTRIIAELANIELNAEGHIDDLQTASRHLERLYQIVGSEDLGELIANAVRSDVLTLQQGRELLAVIPWTGATNGADLQPTLERWLRDGTDSLEIELALNDSVFPFATFGEMESVLAAISARFPELAPQCDRMVTRRVRQRV